MPADRDWKLAKEVGYLKERVTALENALHAICSTTAAARIYLEPDETYQRSTGPEGEQ